MYFKLNKKFTNSSLLNAGLLNDIVSKIIEIGGSLDLKFSNGRRLRAEYINQMINSINDLIPENSGIEPLELSFLDGDSLCSSDLNLIVDKINEIIDFLNNYKEDVYALYVKLKSIKSTFPSTGGLFIVDAYITKNKSFFGIDGIQITSELSYTFNLDGTLTFIIPTSNTLKTYPIRITSEYGSKEFTITLEAPVSLLNDNFTLYVSLPQQIVSANGETIQYTASIRKNGVNYTTIGIKSNPSYPYGISESFTDNGVERIYTVTFDENLSFNIKNYKSSISAYGLQTLNVNVQQEANVATSTVKVYANATKTSYTYYDTLLSFTFYAKVNGITITEGVIPEVISDNIGIVSTNVSNGTAIYTIYRNDLEISKQTKVRAKYNGVYSNVITFTLAAKPAQQQEDTSCNYQISSQKSNIEFENIQGTLEIIIINSENRTLIIKSSPDWVETSISGNTLQINVGNNSGLERNGTIIVGVLDCENVTTSISVKLKAVNIEENKGLIYLSFDYIGDNNEVNTHKYLAGVGNEEFLIYSKKVGPLGDDMDLLLSPHILGSGPEIAEYNVGTAGKNFVHTWRTLDIVDSSFSYNLYGQFSGYENSNEITIEYSQEHGTTCCIEVASDINETYTYVPDLADPDGTLSSPDIFKSERDYHSHDGYITLNPIKKVDGQYVSVSHIELVSIDANGKTTRPIDWYTTTVLPLNNLPKEGDLYKIGFNFNESNIPLDRSIALNLKVFFDDGTRYSFTVSVYQFPMIYLRTYSDYSMVPFVRAYRGLGLDYGAVKCDGSYPGGSQEYSEKITYYATMYNGSPVNSHLGLSGTNFTLNGNGKVVLRFDDDSTVQLDHVEDNENGTAYIYLKPNNTNNLLELYFYVDFVDNNGNVITTTLVLDKFYDRDNIVQSTCTN